MKLDRLIKLENKVHEKFILSDDRLSKLSKAQREFYELATNDALTVSGVKAKSEEIEKTNKSLRIQCIVFGFLCSLSVFLLLATGAMLGLEILISKKYIEISQTTLMFELSSTFVLAMYYYFVRQKLDANKEMQFNLQFIETQHEFCEKAIDLCESSSLANDWRINAVNTRTQLFIGDYFIMERLYFKDQNEQARLKIDNQTKELSDRLYSVESVEPV